VSTWDVAGCACILVMIVMVTELEPKREGEGSDAELAGVETAPLPQDPPVFAGRASVLGYYNSRPATMVDIERVKALLDEGHRAFAELGIDEGKCKKYPSSRRLTRSVNDGSTYVVENAEGQMIAVFAVSFAADKNYERGIKGEWVTNTGASPQQYAELHWVVVDKPVRRRGVGSFIVDSACRIAREGGCVPISTQRTNRCVGYLKHAASRSAGPSRCAIHSGGKSRVPRMSCASDRAA